YVVVLAREELRVSLHDRHLRPEAPIHLPELEPDVAAADDDEMLRDLTQREQRRVREEPAPIDTLQTGKIRNVGARADVDEHARRGERLVTDRDRLRPREARLTVDDGHALHLTEPRLETGARAHHVVVAPLLHDAHVDAAHLRSDDAELRRAPYG